MEMIVMRLVVVWAQDNVKIAAGTVVRCPQEKRLGAIAMPLRTHTYLATVGEREATDVDRVRGSVLATPRLREWIANDVAA
jgi:hypothetical protein